MKKVIAILTVCLVLLAFLPVFPASAADEKVVYIGKGGTGDGTTPDKPTGDLKAAFASFGDGDGVIVFVDMYDHSALHDIAPHAGHITLTSKYGGVDYGGGIYASQTAHLALGGDTTFENMKILIAKTSWLIRARFHHITFGEGMTIENESSPTALSGLYIVGADQGKNSPCDHSQDTHITLKSGNFTEVIGGSRSNDNGNITGKVRIEISGDTRIGKLAYATRSLPTAVNLQDALIVLDGGYIETWASSGDKTNTGFLGDVEIVLTKNFDISKSFNVCDERLTGPTSAGNYVFNGLSGCSAYKNLISDTLFAKAILMIDPTIKAAVDATDKISTESFTEIKEYTYVGVIGSGTLDAAPGTQNPPSSSDTTAIAPSGGEGASGGTTAASPSSGNSPSTGSNTVIVSLGIVFLVAVIALLAINRKSANR